MADPASPTPFQKKICWAGLTSVAAIAVVSAVGTVGWCVVWLCVYLKTVLTPIAIAAVLAYLLTPLVSLLSRWKLPRTWAVVMVFLLFSGAITLIALTVSPALEHQGKIFADRIPAYSQGIATLRAPILP